MRCLPVALVALLVATGCADGDPSAPLPGVFHAAEAVGAVGPVVMTRNLYLGADIEPLLGASTPQQIPVLAAQAWAAVRANDFPRRAGALAAEIVGARPHLVGLQEVATFRVQSPGDAVVGGSSPATAIVYDYLALLLDSLAVRGADYRVVAYVVGNDIEVPVFTGTGFDDVRFTQAEAILARSDVVVANAQGALYGARINTTIGGGSGGAPVSLRRGWASVDAIIGARDQRIDYVFMRGFSETGSSGVGARVRLVGEQLADRTLAGGWASDHAGVVAALRLPPGLTR